MASGLICYGLVPEVNGSIGIVVPSPAHTGTAV